MRRHLHEHGNGENTDGDHIKPISLAKDEEELLTLHSYTNYQPLLRAGKARRDTHCGERHLSFR